MISRLLSRTLGLKGLHRPSHFKFSESLREQKIKQLEINITENLLKTQSNYFRSKYCIKQLN